jgi:3-oxoacid CoA-transferase
VDVAIMGGLQVDQQANLANWAAPGRPLLGVGGAMDLAEGAKRLIITMTHTDKDGRPKLVQHCDLPLTAVQAVDLLITELGVFEFSEGKLTLIEVMQGSSLEEIRDKTSAEFQVALRERPGG